MQAQPKRRPGRPKGSKNKKPRAAAAKRSAKRPVNNNTGAVVKRGRKSNVKRGGADRAVFGGCSNIRVQNLFKKGIEIAQQNNDSRLLMVYYDKKGKNVTFYGSKCDDNDWMRECRKIYKHASKTSVGVYGMNTFDYDRLFGEYHDNSTYEVIKGDWRNLRHLHGGIEQKAAEDAARGARDALLQTQTELERQQACTVDLEVVSMYSQATTEELQNTQAFVSSSTAATTELVPVPAEAPTVETVSMATKSVSPQTVGSVSPLSTGLDRAHDLIEEMAADIQEHTPSTTLLTTVTTAAPITGYASSGVTNGTDEMPLGSPASRADVKRTVFDMGDAHWIDCLVSPQRVLTRKMRWNIFRRSRRS